MVPAALQQFYASVEDCARCKSEGNTLRHVMGGGKFHRPKFLFLFINPTHKNRSTLEGYEGARSFPFIGVRHLYRDLAEAGFIDKEVIAPMYERGWRTGDELAVEESLRTHGVYMSNFVKCARRDPKNPKRSVMKETLPLLAQEFELVQPQYIVTFGQLPTSVLTDAPELRMRDVLMSVKNGTYRPMRSVALNGREYKVLPCFFPLGHGNPPKAHKVLTYIRENF